MLLTEAVAATQEAGTLRSQGRNAEAVACLLKAAELLVFADEPLVAGMTFEEAGEVGQAAVLYAHLAAHAVEQKDDAEIGVSHFKLGRVLGNLGRYSLALSRFQIAAAAYERSGDDVMAAWMFDWIGGCHEAVSDDAQAVVAFAEAVARFTRLKNDEGIAAENNDLGRALFRLGRFAEAIGCLQMSVEAHLRRNAESNAAWSQYWIGMCHEGARDYVQAAAGFAASAARFMKLKEDDGIASAKGGEGRSLYNKGDYDRAAACFQDSAAAYVKIGDARSEARTFGWLGNTYAAAAAHARAAEAYTEAAKRYASLKDEPAAADNESRLGKALFRAGQFADAVPHFESAASVYERLGKASEVAWMHGWRGDCYRDLNDDARAEASYMESVKRFSALKDDSGISINARDLARTLYRLKRYEEAAEHFETAAAAYERLDRPEEAAWIYDWLGFCYRQLGDHANELAAFTKSLERFKKLKVDSGIADEGSNLGVTLLGMERFPEAVIAFHASVVAHERLHGVEHWKTVDARLNENEAVLQGRLTTAQRGRLREAVELERKVLDLCNKGTYREAISLAWRDRDIRIECFGAESRSAASSMQRLGVCLLMSGDARGSEPVYLEAVRIRRKVLGDSHPDCASSLNGLAIVYDTLGDYARAETLYREALDVWRRAGEAESSDSARCLGQLAFLCQRTGDTSRAEHYFLQAIAAQRKVRGERSAACAIEIYNLAGLYSQLGRYDEALPLAEKALEIRLAIFGEHHSDYALSANSLASLYLQRRDFDRAEPLYLAAAAIWKDLLGDQHGNYATAISNLADLYHLKGDDAKAGALHEQVVEIRRISGGDLHPSYASSLCDLAGFYRATGKIERAASLYRQALEISRKNLELNAAGQSERQQLALAGTMRYQLDHFISLGLQTESLVPEIFAEVLRWKGSTLVRQRAMRVAASDPAVAELFGKLQIAAAQLSAAVRAVPQQRDELAAWRTRIEQLTATKERLEAELSKQSVAYRAAMQPVMLDSLLAALPADAVLVDYLEFDRSTPPKRSGDSTSYDRQLVAFVVRHASSAAEQVTMVGLGPAASVAADVETWRESYGSGDQAVTAGARLRSVVWQPVLDSLAAEHRTQNTSPSGSTSATTANPEAPLILVSTDGVLGRLPLGALPGRKPGTYLIEDHRLAMIPVPQLLPTLLAADDARRPEHDLLVLGDVDYDSIADSTTVLPVAAVPVGAAAAPQLAATARSFGSRAPTREGEEFLRLPGTKDEIAAIVQLLRDAWKLTDARLVRLSAGDATEARFRVFAPRCRMLHLATHGYFADPRFQSAASADAAQQGLAEELVAAVTTPVAAPPVVGIGAQLDVVEGRLTVKAVVQGGAAAADGRLKAGDVIRKVGSATGELIDVATMALAEAVTLIRGDAGAKVRLEVLPQGSGAPVVYEMTRQLIPQAAVDNKPSGGEQTQSGRELSVVGYNPGLLSGLAFAGANLPPRDDADDGILTAEEISGLPLDGVRLVTLSACETGLGQTAGGEGLLGLQRAFQVSGVRTTIASYWKVDDHVTCVLMERFYRNIAARQAGQTTALLDALREAQLWVLRNPQDLVAAVRASSARRGADPPIADADSVTGPYYWASFTLSGDWR